MQKAIERVNELCLGLEKTCGLDIARPKSRAAGNNPEIMDAFVEGVQHWGFKNFGREARRGRICGWLAY